MPSVNPYPKIPGHASTNEIHANTEAQAMSMFRASPWVTYDPTANQADMDNMEDVDMDAPQISTLREEETPPPQKPKVSAARRGKATKQAKTAPAWVRPPRKESNTEEEYDEAEEEEDQLIDDDDDEMMKPLPPAALAPSARSADITPKRRVPNKRKPRKSEKRIAEDERKAREKDMSRTAGPGAGASMAWFSATPSETHEEADGAVKEPIPPKAASPKKPGRKAVSAPRPKVKAPILKLKTAIPILADDVGVLSEGHTGTAASSPHFDDNSSDVDINESMAPLVEEISLEGVPLPLYPLPTKPFPVQMPPKIATGFAPVIPLDKSGKRVRHWRTANREIRGIAGGRWFARSWVGEKESEYASAVAAAALVKGGDVGIALPKLSSISAPVRGSGKGKASKAASSLAASAAPSRDGSSIPEVLGTSARPPTKMRMILAPPSEGGDSDMTGVAGS